MGVWTYGSPYVYGKQWRNTVNKKLAQKVNCSQFTDIPLSISTTILSSMSRWISHSCCYSSTSFPTILHCISCGRLAWGLTLALDASPASTYSTSFPTLLHCMSCGRLAWGLTLALDASPASTYSTSFPTILHCISCGRLAWGLTLALDASPASTYSTSFPTLLHCMSCGRLAWGLTLALDASPASTYSTSFPTILHCISCGRLAWGLTLALDASPASTYSTSFPTILHCISCGRLAWGYPSTPSRYIPFLTAIIVSFAQMILSVVSSSFSALCLILRIVFSSRHPFKEDLTADGDIGVQSRTDFRISLTDFVA
ncbi:hypothetical protein GEMRC1_009497 [Eukaryota sp. GEM-RC1]